MRESISWDYPKELFCANGYPTPEALDYIKNWSIIWGVNEDSTKTGKFFAEGKYDELIKYIKTIWTYNDAITYSNGMLELHTGGWSGNEEIISELKHTSLWLLKFRAHLSGGHYYFVVEENGCDWDVNKVERKWMCKKEQKKIITEIMNDDANDGLYNTNGNNVEKVPNVASPKTEISDIHSTITDKIDGMIFELPFDDKMKLWELIDELVAENQTEISDEEIEKGAVDKWDGYKQSDYFSAFEDGAKWYREQLKNIK